MSEKVTGDDAFWRTEEDRIADEQSYLRARKLLAIDEREESFGDIPAPMAKEGVKFDTGKRRVDLVPTEAINALADVLTAGAVKYGEHNWRHGMDWSRVYSAAQWHMLAFWGGDDIDEESGMPHLWHAITNLAFLVSYQALSVGRDDRWKQEDEE